MDARIEEILGALLGTVKVLDEELLRLAQSELITATPQSLKWMVAIEQNCFSTLEVIETLRQRMASSAFVIPPEVMATLEQD